MTGRTVHRSGTVLFSVLMVAIGLALIGQTLGSDTSVLSARLLLGVLFLAAGIARLYLERKRSRQP
jgi:phosphatidylglycerophosphate synthase